MSYDVALQTQYPNVAYRTKSGLPKGATIKSGGCGPSSVRNLGNNLLGWGTTIPAVAQIAVDCGARYNGGTTIGTLLKAMREKYGGFTCDYITSDMDAITAVKAGAMAVIHTAGAVGGTYNKLLSTSGHFLCLADVSGTTATVIDSNAYPGKWSENSVRKKYIKTTSQTGVVKCSIAALSAVVDYYYVVKKTQISGKEVEDMTEAEVRKLIDKSAEEKAAKAVSSWAKETWEKAVECGVLDGTAPQGSLSREQFAAVLDRLGLLDGQVPKVYKTIDDVPDYYKDAVQKMIDCGAISGTGDGELNLSADVCRALAILDNAGLLGVEFTGEETREKIYGDAT
ncbi:MAG: hypothetical protein Q4D42_03105 [Eubacteriales bacterium]|nr:hypothetical protein [Eubacteriales bacterium]